MAECQAAYAKLQDIRQQMLAGKITFADAAKTYSQSSDAAGGGDIGYFPRKWAVEESFARAAFALEKNQVSDVVQTDFGLHLILVTDRKAGQPSDFNMIKDEVRETAAEEMRLNILVEHRKLAKIIVNLGSASGPKPANP